MRVSELISKLQKLNHDHWSTVKHLVPMGHEVPEPEIYVEQYDGDGEFAGFTKDIDVILDLQTGIQILPV